MNQPLPNDQQLRHDFQVRDFINRELQTRLRLKMMFCAVR